MIEDATSRMIKICLGASKADLLIHGNLVNVYTREIMESYIGITGDRIAYIGKKHIPSRKEIEINSGYILPAYIDGHIHIESSLMIPSRFAAAVIPKGTCCVIADPHEIANVMGIDGIKFMIEDSLKTPLRTYFMIPSCVPPTNLETSGAEIGLKEINELRRYKHVIGLGEVMNFSGVLSRDRKILDKIIACRDMIIDGHAPRLVGAELCAYASVGISSDHECVSVDEALERLSLGMWVMIREGSTSKNLRDLIEIISAGSPERVMLVTDDRHAGDILTEGHIDNCLRRAVEEGLDPLDAVRLVTLKPAEYFGLRDLGGLAPGKFADLVVVDDLVSFDAKLVLIGGEIVAKDGRYLVEIEEPPAEVFKNTVNIGEVKVEDFSVKCGGEEATIRVIGVIEGQLYTESLKFRVEVVDGEIGADPQHDILKICVIERHRGSGRVGKGFVRGFGMKEGAIASTVAHDSHNIIVVGASDIDMCVAVNRLREIGGGLIAVSDGEVLAELPLPVAGLMSPKKVEDIAEKLDRLHQITRSLGCILRNPFMTLSFLALPVIPKLKITDYGLIDVEKQCVTSLILNITEH